MLQPTTTTPAPRGSMLMLTGLLLALATPLTAQDQAPPPPKSPLRVFYVGEQDNPDRTTAFRQFLAARFAAVETATHETFDRRKAAAFDVVLLDWHQGSGEFPPKSCPLGPRAEWTRPTVLLGSAGLHLACVWEVDGGAG